MSTQKFATQALHAVHDAQKNGGTRAVPVYLCNHFARSTDPTNNNPEQIISIGTVANGTI